MKHVGRLNTTGTNVIIANRRSESLKDVVAKCFSRDLFNID